MKAGAIGAAKRPHYLFSGLTKCGICGAGFIMSAKNRPGCFGARDQGRCDDHLTIRCDPSTRNSTRATAALSAAVAENVRRPLTVAVLSFVLPARSTARAGPCGYALNDS